MKKTFIVAMVSENTNSFGLHGMILVAQDGESWEVAANALNVKAKGERIEVDSNNFAGLGFEIPKRMLSNCPRKLVQKLFATPIARPYVDYLDPNTVPVMPEVG